MPAQQHWTLAMASIKDVARLAEVSTATVSRYINDPELVKKGTREKVQAAIKATGYSLNTLARNFRRGKSGIIFVVLPSIGDPFFSGVMSGLMKAAKQHKYSIVIREAKLDSLSAEQYNDMIISKQADGIILLASVYPFSDNFAKEQACDQPIVLGCESVSSELNSFPNVRIDNYAAAKDATEHLITLGHKRVAFIYGDKSSTLTQDRERGFRDAMQEAGLQVPNYYLEEGGLSIGGARLATTRLLAQVEKPTAIFCANDEMAIGCMHEVKTAKLRIPEDISIIGFDDIRYAEVQDPPLTTIAQPTELIGKRVLLRLIDAIEGKDTAAKTEIIPHQLIMRKSTAKATS
ncbi:LacI family DNA-binding transcriptional regulator [Agaribacterium sp. ZY112]|uniref:LacI family DNA-binding transcriptional regulator n=1 Tax=Agaribacterium sp. ZY112 TaxID=3233574 RepID=UPI0035251380